MFGGKLREANKTIKVQREILSQQEDRLKSLVEQGSDYLGKISDLSEQLSTKTMKLDELTEKVREQNEADLLLVSMKIIEEIKKGTPKKDSGLISLQQEQERLRRERAAMGSSYFGSHGLQNMGMGLQGMIREGYDR